MDVDHQADINLAVVVILVQTMTQDQLLKLRRYNSGPVRNLAKL